MLSAICLKRFFAVELGLTIHIERRRRVRFTPWRFAITREDVIRGEVHNPGTDLCSFFRDSLNACRIQ